MVRPIHAVDAGAVSLPVLSFAAHLPGIMTVVTALLGAIWYAVQLYDRFKRGVPHVEKSKDKAD